MLFYKKPVASPFTILQRSAMPSSTKRNTMFQEALRRMRTCDKSLPWAEKAKHLSSWGNMLRVSGYYKEYRYNILKGAIIRNESMLESEKTGEIDNFYRNRRQIVDQKTLNGGKTTSATWFLKGKTTVTHKTVVTPNSDLMSALQKHLKTVSTPDG
jgi:hypothetical protein